MTGDKRENPLFTLISYALGDAWGYTVEFKSHDFISKMMEEEGVNIPSLLKISDDTQMSLYTLQALSELNSNTIKDSVTDHEALNRMRRRIASHYLVWMDDKDNYRAPGRTCLSSLSHYQMLPEQHKIKGNEGGFSNYSLGCGTVMRAPWIGLLPFDDAVIATVSMAQAQVTHGDPKGWVVSALASLIVKKLYNNDPTWSNLSGVDVFIETEKLLDTLLLADTLIYENHDDIHQAINSVRADLEKYVLDWGHNKWFLEDESMDINDIFGEGWIADEAFYNALGALALYGVEVKAEEDGVTPPHSLLKGLRRLVCSNGDSDSIAAIGGAFLAAKLYDNSNADKVFFDIMEYRLEPRYRHEIAEAADIIHDFWHFNS